MLKILVPKLELFDESKGEFHEVKEQELQLEHSLVSLSKWESKWKKPFLTKGNKTTEETLDYIRCMTLTQNVDPKTYLALNSKIVDEVSEYIYDSMTATTFSDQMNKSANREVITAEIIYYWMITFSIPFECQKWHLERLLTLIKVCSIKNQPKKKLKPGEIAARNRSLNEARKAKLGTKG